MSESLEIKEMSKLDSLLSPLRNLIFGAQSERLEYLMDSFFKLSVEQRIVAVIGGVLSFLLLIISIISFYLVSLNKLQTDLDQAFAATNSLKEIQTNFLVSRQKEADLEAMLQVNQNLSIISTIEAKAKEMNVTVSDFPSQQEVTSVTVPLSSSALKNHQVARVRFSIPKTGLKKIVEFIIALESTPNKMHTTSLTIKRGFTDKLYLDAVVEVEAILPPSK